MRKKVNGRIYDTSTAKHVGVNYHNRVANDGFSQVTSCYDTHFFRKRTGELFYTYNGVIYTDYDCVKEGYVGGSGDILKLYNRLINNQE